MPPKKGAAAQNLFQAPPSDGTTSPQRAARWQGQEEAPKPESREKKGVTIAAEDFNDDPGSATGSGSTAPSRKSTASSRKKKGVVEEKEPVDPGPKVPDDNDWFGDPCNPGIDASLGPGGCLHSFVKQNGSRAGMCNPPMNPVVRAALLADLNAFGTTPIVRTGKEKAADLAAFKLKQKEDTKEAKTVLSPSEQMKAFKEKQAKAQARAAAKAAAEPDPGFLAAMAQSSPSLTLHGGSQSSSRLGSAAHVTRKSVPAQHHTHGHRANSPFCKTRKKKHGATFQLDDTAKEGQRKKGDLATAPQGEVKFHSFALKRMSRDHGFTLEKMCVKEAGELRMYHNIQSRNSLDHPVAAAHPIHPSRQLKDLGGNLMMTSQSLPSYSLDAAAMLIPAKPVFRNQYNLGNETGAPSMERLLEMANSVMHSTPHVLQHMCEVAHTSVHTAGKVQQGYDSMGNSQMLSTMRQQEDDPLFSSRLGETPRTSTGKALPVPYWGKNGNAPALRPPPELRLRSQG